MTISSYLITALGTPLNESEHLHEEGLALHLEDQWGAGINGILVAGSMGLMQMLRDQTYQDLVRRSVEMTRGRGELLVGVGDTSLVRTRDRIEIVSRYKIDGVVAVAPYFFRFSQEEMIDYFRALADSAPVPLYLYDLPVRTGVALDVSTYEALARHPNIRGAKISGRIDVARELMARLGETFRIIVAEPQMMADLLREDIRNHLDGIFTVAPRWFVELAQAADAGDWPQADRHQSRVNQLLDLLCASSSVLGAFTVMLNARGIPGNFHSAPSGALSERERESLLQSEVMQSLHRPPIDQIRIADDEHPPSGMHIRPPLAPERELTGRSIKSHRTQPN